MTIAPPLTEAAFMAQVTQFAELCGWEWGVVQSQNDKAAASGQGTVRSPHPANRYLLVLDGQHLATRVRSNQHGGERCSARSQSRIRTCRRTDSRRIDHRPPMPGQTVRQSGSSRSRHGRSQLAPGWVAGSLSERSRQGSLREEARRHHRVLPRVSEGTTPQREHGGTCRGSGEVLPYVWRRYTAEQAQ